MMHPRMLASCSIIVGASLSLLPALLLTSFAHWQLLDGSALVNPAPPPSAPLAVTTLTHHPTLPSCTLLPLPTRIPCAITTALGKLVTNQRPRERARQGRCAIGAARACWIGLPPALVWHYRGWELGREGRGRHRTSQSRAVGVELRIGELELLHHLARSLSHHLPYISGLPTLHRGSPLASPLNPAQLAVLLSLPSAVLSPPRRSANLRSAFLDLLPTRPLPTMKLTRGATKHTTRSSRTSRRRE